MGRAGGVEMSVSAVTKDISFEGMALDALAEMANEAGEQVEKHARTAVKIAITAGKALTAAKAQLAHGEWAKWLAENWNYSQPTASRYMTIANYSSMNSLEQAEDVNHALRIIAEDPTTPKRERKSGQVAVRTPENPKRSEVEPKDDDPNPAPRSNTRHSEDTRRKREDEKPRTAAVAVKAEIVDPEETDSDDDADRREAALGQLEEIVEILGLTTVLRLAVNLECSDCEKKARAEVLRKAADLLDPDGAVPVSSKKAERPGSTPAASELVKMIPKEWPKILQAAAQDWCEHKQSLTRRERIQSTKAWQIALKQMAEQKADVVARKINKAIANNWKGWDHEGKSEVSQKSAAFYRNPGPKKPVRFDNVDYGDEG